MRMENLPNSTYWITECPHLSASVQFHNLIHLNFQNDLQNLKFCTFIYLNLSFFTYWIQTTTLQEVSKLLLAIFQSMPVDASIKVFKLQVSLAFRDFIETIPLISLSQQLLESLEGIQNYAAIKICIKRIPIY